MECNFSALSRALRVAFGHSPVENANRARPKYARPAFPTGSPLTGGAYQASMIAQNSYTATSCVRALARIARRHSSSERREAFFTSLSLCVVIALSTLIMYATPRLVTIPSDGQHPAKQVHDTDRQQRHPKKARPAKQAAPRPHGIPAVQGCSADQACDISAPDDYQPPQ